MRTKIFPRSFGLAVRIGSSCRVNELKTSTEVNIEFICELKIDCAYNCEKCENVVKLSDLSRASAE